MNNEKTNIMEFDYFSDNNFIFDEEIRNCFTNFNTEKHNKNKPTDEAYLFFPREEKIIFKKTDEIYIRKIFSVLKLKEFEEKLLKNLNSYNDIIIKKTNKNTIEDMKKTKILRFLYTNKFDYEKTLNNINLYNDWKSKFFPINLNEDLIEILGFSGFCYCHGRDHEYRPIIFIRMDLLKNKTKFIIEDFRKAIIFLYDYIENKMLIPGQIEQWNIFMDFSNINENDPLENFEDFIYFIINFYETRINNIDIYNPTNKLNNFFDYLKKILLDRLDIKVFIRYKNNLKMMFENVRKEQVEVKYGGSAKNLYENIDTLRKNLSIYFEKNISSSSSADDILDMDLMIFFPPIMPSDIFKADKILSKSCDNKNYNKKNNKKNTNNNNNFTINVNNNNIIKRDSVFLKDNSNEMSFSNIDKSCDKSINKSINKSKVYKYSLSKSLSLNCDINTYKKIIKNDDNLNSSIIYNNNDIDIKINSNYDKYSKKIIPNNLEKNNNDNKDKFNLFDSNTDLNLISKENQDNSKKPKISAKINSKDDRFKGFFSKLKVYKDETEYNNNNSSNIKCSNNSLLSFSNNSNNSHSKIKGSKTSSSRKVLNIGNDIYKKIIIKL
jgi:hypothetical protein